jgi:hypothetical protein
MVRPLSEARTLRWRRRAQPAIGASGRLPRSVIIWRCAIALGLILLLGVTKIVVTHLQVTTLTMGPPDYVIAAGLDIGPAPTDDGMQEMATYFRVDAVINLDTPNVEEQATAASLHLAYRYLPLASGTAPTWAQLRTLVVFMRAHTAGGGAVFVHDDVGGGRAVATAAMLLLLRGETWPKVTSQLSGAELQTLTAGQLVAINQLSTALRLPGSRMPANPYSAARIDPW